MSGIEGFVRGLEGIIAAPTKICDLDGVNGRLAYGGYSIEELAAGATYEEVVYLLWHGELPTKAQLGAHTQALVQARPIPEPVVQAMRLYPPRAVSMSALRAAVAQLGLYDPEAEDNSHDSLLRKSVRIVAQTSTITAAFHRIRSGQPVVAPSRELGHAANFLSMLTGKAPDPRDARALDVSLILYAEHEMNASTFAARVTASTVSDLYSAVTSGVGTIKGPLHGGAGEAVMLDLQEMGTLENVEPFVMKALTAKRRFMGFGHRVYKSGDPRARILRGMAEEVCQRAGQSRWYQMSAKLHEVVTREKGMHPNVDFYSASLFLALGLPVDLNVPVITVARTAGWTAQLLEQYADNRLFRPRAAYVGPARRPFVPLEQRA